MGDDSGVCACELPQRLASVRLEAERQPEHTRDERIKLTCNLLCGCSRKLYIYGAALSAVT